jgi:hypothetical protein
MYLHIMHPLKVETFISKNRIKTRFKGFQHK